MRFVDTDVLLYAISAVAEQSEKRDRAIALLKEDGLAISVQVLQEFYYQATRPARPGALTPERALRFVQALDHVPVQPVTIEVFLAGVSICRRFGLSYWDGAILAAASAMGCDAVYSEDLSDTQDYGGLHIINPFADAPASP